ncbi:DNA primase [Denitromonas iodatirespirans]|uniref:DNA primase n=1 Tax=Denitromonas iodatirespirans TaxID=2795389 RepID=A0A944H890_DENI1|nr:DNA primase [Denitromonas iodatirespirans]MBT0962048.1 DNA primase [Denitromonas iodatirespirans]
MIPQSFIQDLLTRVDIVDVIDRHVSLKKQGANYFACCPFHGEKSASFSVSPSKQFYHCFGCGAHGSAIGFLMEYSGLSYVEAIHELARQVGVDVPEERKARRGEQQKEQSLTELMGAAARFYREQLKGAERAIDYLKRRGLTGQIAARFGIGYAPDGWQSLQKVVPNYADKSLLEAGLVIENDQGRRYDRFRDRIMFPIQDSRGNVIAFGGRILDQGEPKYLNSPETPLFEKGRELYGLFQARPSIRSSNTVIVVEGYMDVVALAQHGVPNAVATLGTSTTATHIQKLFRHADRVVFCFDGDAAGRKAAWRGLEAALETLNDVKQVAFLFLPDQHDPDTYVREFGADAFTEQVANATPLTEFLLGELAGEADLSSAEGRARYAHEAKPLVLRIGAGVLKLQVLKAVAKRCALDERELMQAWGLTPPPPPSRTNEPWRKGKGRRDDAEPPAVRGPRHQPRPLEANLLRIVLHHPAWAARLPVDLIPPGSDEGRALIAIIDAVSVGDLGNKSAMGTLLEHFRHTPHELTLTRMCAEQAEDVIDEAVVETVFHDTVHALHAKALEDEFNRLAARAGELTPDERKRYAQLLQQKKRNPKPQPKVSDS